MIKVGDIYVDKIRSLQVVDNGHMTYHYSMVGRCPKAWFSAPEIQVNGQDTGLTGSEEECEKEIKKIIKRSKQP